jgi:hypothetical protein
MSAAEQSPAHRISRRPLVTFEQVPVHVLGDGDAGVTEDLRDHVQWRALGQHQRRPGVAQLVRMPVTQPRPLAESGEGMREVIRVHRRPDLTGEDQPVVLPQCPGRHLRLSLPYPMLPKPGHQLGSEHQEPTRFRRLQFTDHQASPATRRGITVFDSVHTMRHPQRASLPVQDRHLAEAGIHPLAIGQDRPSPLPGGWPTARG